MSLGFQIVVGLAGLAGPWVLRLLYSSCRVRCLNPDRDRQIWNRPFVGGGFHKPFLFHSWYFRNRRMVIMVSRSKDGEIVSRVLQQLGFITVRGSSSRGGGEALDELIDLGRRGFQTSLITDGPRGPARVPKIGVVRAARETGHPIAPFAVVVEKAFEFRNWDRTAIPMPFSRIAIKWGELIPVPPDASKEECERYRIRLQEALMSLETELQIYLAQTGRT